MKNQGKRTGCRKFQINAHKYVPMPSSFVFCLFEGEITLENLLHMALTSAQKETADFSFKPVAAPRDGQQEVER